MKESLGPRGALQKTESATLSSGLSPGDLQPSLGGLCTGGSHQPLWGPLHPGSELTLCPRDPECRRHLTAQRGCLRSSGDGRSFSSDPSQGQWVPKPTLWFLLQLLNAESEQTRSAAGRSPALGVVWLVPGEKGAAEGLRVRGRGPKGTRTLKPGASWACALWRRRNGLHAALERQAKSFQQRGARPPIELQLQAEPLDSC